MTTYGHTATGRPIDDHVIDRIAAEAEAGYPDWQLKIGRPPMDKGPSRSRTFRLGSTLDAALEARAEAEQVSPSAIVRAALAEYLLAA
ncbi:MAG: ribbon-helix-helix protein, CopG family [Actinomycetia bacterium]|nr:ribbon-helix-helix protein, CopG family [Actinomycetes bacterium]